MKHNLTPPIIQRGLTNNERPALLLTVGTPRQWPVLIAPDDFALVTETTGYRAWGFQCGQVVVGDPGRSFGRRSVAKIIAGISGTSVRVVYRDGNPLNLLRENMGLRRNGGVFWLVLQPGEADPIHFGGAFPTMIPRAIFRHRDVVCPPRDPAQAALPADQQHWTQRGA